MDKKSFRNELENLINRHSMENESDTPDFILADYLMGCLENFENTIQARERWYGRWDDNSKTTPPVTVGISENGVG